MEDKDNMIYNESDNIMEDATQSSNIAGGRVDIFGSPDKFNYNKWYKELLELKDYEDDEYINLNKEAFSSYCSDKLEDLDNIEIDGTIYKKIMYTEGIRNYHNLYIIADFDDPEFENLMAINSDNEIVINTNMIDYNAYAASMQFDKIDKEYFEMLMKNWNLLNMDEYFEE